MNFSGSAAAAYKNAMLSSWDTARRDPAAVLEQGVLLWRSASWGQLVAHAALAIVTALSLLLIRRRYLSPVSHIPGPFLASFSRLWHVRQIIRGDQNLKIIEEHDKHGHFVRISHNEVSVSHPNGIRQLLLATVPKGDWYKVFCFPDYRYPTPISLTSPKDKIERSKHLASGFLQHNILQSEDLIDQNVDKFLDWMDRYAASGKPMDLDKFFTYVAFDITGEVIFSKPFGFLDAGDDVRGAIAMNLGLEIYVSIFGFYRWVHWLVANPLVTWTQLVPMGHLANTAMGALAERQKNPDARYDVSAHWFRSLARAEQEAVEESKSTGRKAEPRFTLRHLQAAASSNVGAGSDTVSCGLQSFVYHMIKVPGAWERARREVDELCGGGAQQKRVIGYDDAAKLPYLQACLKEALRIFGPVPMGLPRVAPRGGITIGDRHFPEGVTLSVSPWVYHYSEELWGPDAREFRPERWLEGEGDSDARDKYFIPWGAGYASCPGQHIARIQLSKIAATLVRDYDVAQVDPEKEWTWAAYFTVVPHDWPVYITKRG